MSKKVVAFSLVVLMLMTLLPGCSKKVNNKDNSNSNATVTSTFKGYPMDKKDTKLTWWVGTGYTLNAAYGKASDSPFHSGLAEQLGVTIDWQFPTAGTDGNQAFNTMLASEKLPDIIFWGLMSDAERYMEEGVIRDLTKEMPVYSPAYYKFIKSNQTYDKFMKTDSGKYYGYGFFREDGGWNDSCQGPVVRRDWLKAQNLEEPKTISDWDNVLKVFKDKYGAQFAGPWDRFKQGGISGAFGAYGSINTIYYVDPNGKVQLAQAQPEWKNYMQKLNEWWKEGLLDKDIMTMNDKIAQSKALNGKTGLSYTSMGQLTNWITDAKKANNGAEWAGLQYPTSDDGKLPMIFGGYGIGTVVAVVTKSCPDEKLETAMRALDYAYTKDGNLYWNFGKKGVSWDYNKDNEVEYTKLVTEDKDGLNNAISKYGGSTWSGSCIQATRMLYLKNIKEAIEANNTWYNPNKDIAAKWTYPAAVTFKTDESNQLEELQNAISTYASETAAKFITGQQSFDTFDSYVKKLNDMGLEKVLKIRQDAYDRFTKR